MKPEDIIQTLQLEGHEEGGFFKRTYTASEEFITKKHKKRKIMTSIYYLLTRKNPLSWLTVNGYDLILYYHLGDPLKSFFYRKTDPSMKKS